MSETNVYHLIIFIKDFCNLSNNQSNITFTWNGNSGQAHLVLSNNARCDEKEL